MRAGPLRHRVRIEEPTRTRDAGGGWNPVTWTLVDVVPASIESAGAGEPSEADALAATQQHIVRTRFRTGVNASQRLKLVGTERYFRVLTVVDPDARRRELVWTCIEKDDEASANAS